MKCQSTLNWSQILKRDKNVKRVFQLKAFRCCSSYPNLFAAIFSFPLTETGWWFEFNILWWKGTLNLTPWPWDDKQMEEKRLMYFEYIRSVRLSMLKNAFVLGQRSSIKGSILYIYHLITDSASIRSRPKLIFCSPSVEGAFQRPVDFD